MPHIAAGTDTKRDAAYQRWVEHFEGPLPYLESITLDRREAHCVREIIRAAFAAGWKARGDAHALPTNSSPMGTNREQSEGSSGAI